MTGKIHASSADIYQDQAKALFDYYEKMAGNIVQQEMSLEKAIKGAEEELLQIQQFLKTATTQGIIFLSVGGVVIAFGWLAHFAVSLLGLVPAAIGAYKLRTAKETAATRTAEKQSQIQGFQGGTSRHQTRFQGTSAWGRLRRGRVADPVRGWEHSGRPLRLCW